MGHQPDRALCRWIGAVAIAISVLASCQRDAVPRGIASPRDTNITLSRETAAEQLRTDSLWKRGEVWVTYAFVSLPMSCDAWTRVASTRAPLHTVLERESLVEYRDSSAIGIDSVAHVCIERPSTEALAWQAGAAHPPNAFLLAVSEDAGSDAPETYELNLRTAHLVLDSITGILQAPNAIEARVEFTLRTQSTLYGDSTTVVRSRRAGTAMFRRFDDGWRLAAVN